MGGVTLSAGHTVANSIELTTCRLLDMHTRSNLHRKAIFKNLYEDSCNMLITCTCTKEKCENWTPRNFAAILYTDYMCSQRRRSFSGRTGG